MQHFSFVLDMRLEGAVTDPVAIAPGETRLVVQAIEPTAWGSGEITWQWTVREDHEADGTDYWVDDAQALSTDRRATDRISVGGKRYGRFKVTAAAAGSSGRTRLCGAIT